MNSKVLAISLMVFGLVFAFVECGRLTERANDNDSSESDDDSVDTNADDDASLREEKRAIRNFLENEENASQFLDQSRRLFSDPKSHMKEAKKKYEEKCERLLNPRYCPDLTTWPAWNQAWNSASGKK